MIEIKDLSATYRDGKEKVLYNFSLTLAEKESYALIGPSGCGKSTLIKILCGIHTEFSGTILYNSRPLFDQNLSIGYVPQSYGLLNWKTVKENIYLPYILDQTKKIDEKEAEEIIEILELEEMLDKFPLQLSGGQRQRVALARAFILRPDLLLMDEPFSSLDSFTSANSQKLYLELWKKYNITTLAITHNIAEAVELGKTILIMSKDSGKIINKLDNPSFLNNNKLQKLEEMDKVMNVFSKVIV